MKEYKVEKAVSYRAAEELMNDLAKEGWRVVSTAINSSTARMVITFEREKEDNK